jgi:hypothetical protein
MRAFAFTLLFVSTAAIAQQQDEAALPKLRIVPEECGPSRPADEIVVCGSREKRSPYRLPKLKEGFDWRGPVDSVARERARLMEGDESGIGSCSNRGPGGMTGCWLQEVKNKRLQQGR